MAVAAEVITTILVVVLLLATAVTMVIGILGGVFGEGFERCPQCRRVTLCVKGQTHPAGCPATLHEHLEHLVDATFRGVHLRHH
jgi:hypothetical protein